MSHIPTRLSLAVVLVVLLTSLAAAPAFAQSGDDEETYAQLESMVEPYNSNVGDADLGPINLAGVNNLYIEDGEETLTYSLVVDGDDRITETRPEGDDDAVRRIETDRDTFDRVTTADDPAGEFRDAVAADEIVIRGEDGRIVEQFKWGVINLFKGLLL